MKRVLVDACVLMEIMLARDKLELCREQLQNADKEFYASTLTAHILYYFGEQIGIDRKFVAEVVAVCGLLSVAPGAVALAQQRYKDKDFEDCLQAACAELNDCDEILTLDKSFAKDSATMLTVRVV